jgi:O-antigen/teichoic acid export membrane protein
LLLSQIVVLASSLAANVIVARAIGADGRGAVAFILQASYIVTAVSALGRDAAYPATARVEDFPSALREQSRLMLVPALAVAGICVLILAFADGAMSFGAEAAIVLAALSWGGLISRMSRASALASRVVRWHLAVVSTSQALLLAVLVALWSAGATDPNQWLWAYAATGALPYLILTISLGRGRRTAGSLRLTRQFALRLYPSTLVEIAVMRADRILIPILANYAELGRYVAVATMAEVSAWPARQYADSRVAYWARKRPTPRGWGKEIAIVVALAAVPATVAGLAIFVWLVPIFGTDFAPATNLVVPLSAAAFGAAMYRSTLNIGVAMTAHRITTIQASAGGVTAAILYPTLIASHGALGAAWGSFAALMAGVGAGLVAIMVDAPRSMRNTSDVSKPKSGGQR